MVASCIDSFHFLQVIVIEYLLWVMCVGRDSGAGLEEALIGKLAVTSGLRGLEVYNEK